MLNLTETAVEKVKYYATAKEEYKDKYLRIFIQGGGCSGFQYGFAFDDKREDDQMIAGSEEVSILVDPQSATHLEGSTVDYVEDLRGSGFVVDNPNATSSCGCGTSFNSSADSEESASAAASATPPCGSTGGGCC